MNWPQAFRVETPFRTGEGERELYAIGHVDLRGRWPRVSGLQILDNRTNENMHLDELPDWIRDKAEEVLIEEAKAIGDK